MVLRLTLIFIMVSISGCACIYWAINDNSKEAKQFLKNNMATVNTSDDLRSIPNLDSCIPKYQIFLLGEEHGISANRKIEMRMLKYFHRTANIKYFILEAQHSYAIKINKYLETGNYAYVDSAFKPLKGTYAWTLEYAEFWKDFFAYNNSINIDDRISCIGIDVEHQSGAAINFLNQLIPDSMAPSEIDSIIVKLKNTWFSSGNYKIGWELAELLSKNHSKYQNIYRKYLGDNYLNFKEILENIINAKKFHTAPKTDGKKQYLQFRDSIMYSNLLDVYKLDSNAKMYGFFGSTHVYRNKYYSTNYLAALLESEYSPYKGKILSIGMNYQDCLRLTRSGYKIKKYNGPFQNKIFDFYEDDNLALINLTGMNSPFETFRFYPFYKTGTNKLIQYILLVKNSNASTPYKQKSET